jgi:checkpoint serine/threonine-protein kinase
MSCFKFPVFVDQDVPAPRTDPKTPAPPQSNENAGVPLRTPKPPPVFSENFARPNVFSKVFTPAPADGKQPLRSKPTFTPLRDPINPTFKVFSRPGTQPENTPKPIFRPFVDNSKRSENEVRRRSVGKQVTIAPSEAGGDEEGQGGEGAAGHDSDNDGVQTPDKDEENEPSHRGRYGKQIDVLTPITERTFEVTTTTMLRPHDANDATSAALELAAELRADEESDPDRDERGLRYDTAFSPQYSDSQDDEDEDDSYRFITDDPVRHRQIEEIEERTGTLSLEDVIAVASSFRPPNPCIPFDGPITSALLSLAPPESTFHDFRNEDKDHLAALQKFCKKRERDRSDEVFALDIGENVYEVMTKLGEGGFGAVFAAADVERQLKLQEEVFVAVKVVRPKNLWEFHVLKNLRASLPPHLRVSIIEPQALYVFRDESYLILDMCTQGTLLELVNRAQEINVAEKGACLRESLVMFFTIELLRLVEGMHAAGFIHGDLKIDNCLLRLGDAPLSSTYDPSGAGGWSDKGIKLIDFGRTIDTRQFPADQQFLADWPTDAKDCLEMREGLPWTHQPDYFGLAGIVYCMLYGKYFEDKSVVLHPGEDGEQRYRLAVSFKRYWQADTWARFFDLLLNPTSVREDGSLPLCPELGALREEMEEVLVAKDRSHGSALPLKALLGKIIIASDER